MGGPMRTIMDSGLRMTGAEFCLKNIPARGIPSSCVWNETGGEVPDQFWVWTGSEGRISGGYGESLSAGSFLENAGGGMYGGKCL